jgi:GNAT superfamily N-acetyltransferase
MTKPFTIRPATASDAGRIHALHTHSVSALCKDHYSPEQISGWLKNRCPQGYLSGIAGIKRGEMFVAEAGPQIVGFGHAVPGEIRAIYVAPENAQQGVGFRLLAYGIEKARAGSHRDVCLDATLNALDFYKKAGFVEVEQ